jgi:hypothetical protein
VLIGQFRQVQVDNLSQRKVNLLNDIMQPTAIIPYVSICAGNASESRCTLPSDWTKSFTGSLVFDFDYQPVP